MSNDFLTTRQVGEILGKPEWRIRRVVDAMAGIGRFGGKRLIPRELLPKILSALTAESSERQEVMAR
jgi:hypothetical protein